MSRERSAHVRGGSSEKLSAPPSDHVRAFICTHVVEEVQELARSLIRDGGSTEERAQLVDETYKKVTQALATFPTDRDDDVRFLAGVVKQLFALEPTESEEYGAEDIFCSAIADVKFRNRNNGSEIEFIHNLLSTIQRIGVLANCTGEDLDKNVDANEEFLTFSSEELEVKIRLSQREFFHRI
jgi:hypothetical protein